MWTITISTWSCADRTARAPSATSRWDRSPPSWSPRSASPCCWSPARRADARVPKGGIMNRRATVFAALATALTFFGGAAIAAPDAAKQAEVRKSAQATLEKFYKAKPATKAEVQGAPGYAVFTTYGISFIVGGAGGAGLAHDNKTNADTFI